MKVLVLGAGAIGGYFGGKLAAAGGDVTFLVRPGRKAQLDRDGLVITGPSGDVKIAVKTVLAADVHADYDVVLFTAKSYDLESAMDAITPAMKGDCAVLPMLNGLSHLDALDARFGREHVLGGLCAIAATMKKDGTIVQIGDFQRMVLGARTENTTQAVAFANALAKTTIDYELSDRIELDLWEKLAFLSAAAALTCLFRANIAEIMAAPGGPEAIDRAIKANIEIAAREGFPLRQPALDFMYRTLTTPSKLTASMLRDVESGSAVESDHVVGLMLGYARKHSIDDTILSLAYTHLKAYENRRAAGRAVVIA
jgi:2-dehydropantoate 2-reductase